VRCAFSLRTSLTVRRAHACHARSLRYRPTDEPQLDLGDRVAIKDGVVGVVLARYKPSGSTDQIHYVLELRPEGTGGRKRMISLKAAEPAD
jgi:hypothetical protein